MEPRLNLTECELPPVSPLLAVRLSHLAASVSRRKSYVEERDAMKSSSLSNEPVHPPVMPVRPATNTSSASGDLQKLQKHFPSVRVLSV